MDFKKVDNNNKIVYINFDKQIIAKCECKSKLYYKKEYDNKEYYNKKYSNYHDERYASYYCNIVIVLELYDFSSNIILGSKRVGCNSVIEKKKILNLKELIKKDKYLYMGVNKTFLGALICYYSKINNIMFYYESNGLIKGFKKNDFYFLSKNGIYNINKSLAEYYINFFNDDGSSLGFDSKTNTCVFLTWPYNEMLQYLYIIKRKKIIIKKITKLSTIIVVCNKKLSILKIIEEKDKIIKYTGQYPFSKKYQKICDELILYFNFMKSLIKKELKYLPEMINEARKIII